MVGSSEEHLIDLPVCIEPLIVCQKTAPTAVIDQRKLRAIAWRYRIYTERAIRLISSVTAFGLPFGLGEPGGEASCRYVVAIASVVNRSSSRAVLDFIDGTLH